MFPAIEPPLFVTPSQKQRVAIAGALAERPAVLLLDELTTFLDEGEQTNVLTTLRSIVDTSRERGGQAVTAILVTHRYHPIAENVVFLEVEASLIVPFSCIWKVVENFCSKSCENLLFCQV